MKMLRAAALMAGAGALVLTAAGSASADEIHGTAGPDKLTGNPDWFVGDEIFGYGGNDVISGLDGPDWLYGGAGDDVLMGHGAGTGVGDEDMLVGGSGRDVLKGGGDTDSLFPETGNDQVDGGADSDVVIISPDKQAVVVNGVVKYTTYSDVIDCGAGVDEVRLVNGKDPKDQFFNCEHFTTWSV